MKFSTSNEYAVHALVYVARTQARGPVQLAEVARAIKVPESYLRKVFQLLARRGIVATQRGAKGGVTLARDAGSVTLRDVVEAVDGSVPSWTCLKVQRGCSVTEVCPVKSAFDEAGRRMAEVLEATSIGDLAKGLSRRAATWLEVSQSA